MQTSELTAADKQAVEAQIENYRKAALAGDWEAWGRTLTADVFASPANVPPMTGRDAVVAWATTFPTITRFVVHIDEVNGSGNVAYARGRHELAMNLVDGTAIEDRGSWLQIHRRQPDGTWPYTHLMFHSIEPDPEALAE